MGEDLTTVIDGMYVLSRKIGKGGMATVYEAEVDLNRFDYTTLYAYTQVNGDSHAERRNKAEALAAHLRTKTLDIATMCSILEAQGIPIPGSKVAVKVATEESSLERFEAEWKNLLCLNHPHVIQVYGGGIYQGRPYYAMELLEDMVDPEVVKAELTIREKVELLIQAGRGLHYLHENGIVHRDIKPDNMVSCRTAAGGYHTKVTDLGLGKQIGDSLALTHTNAILGSPAYMSPEQITNTRNVDHRTDIYSMGASLYEYICGLRPYHNKTTVYELISSVSRGEPPLPVREHAPHLPVAISTIIETAMHFNPQERYNSVMDLVTDLETYLAHESPQLTGSIQFAKSSDVQSTVSMGNSSFIFEDMEMTRCSEVPASSELPYDDSSQGVTVDTQRMVEDIEGAEGIDETTQAAELPRGPRWKLLVVPLIFIVTLVIYQFMPPENRVEQSSVPPASLPPKVVSTPPTPELHEVSAPPSQREEGGFVVPEMVVSPEEFRALLDRRGAEMPTDEGFPFDAPEAQRRQREYARKIGLPAEVRILFAPHVYMDLVLIPAGEFTMGLSSERLPELHKRYFFDGAYVAVVKDAAPPHRVRITKPFYAGRTETTVELWNYITRGIAPNAKGGGYPIHRLAFAALHGPFFSQLNERIFGSSQFMGFDLPSEAQWEYACRAGSESLYYHGDDQGGLGDYAWYSENANKVIHPVGQKKPNAWGLYDMQGNVWEWCRDWFKPPFYIDSPIDDPEATNGGIHRILRGGSYLSHGGYTSAYFRGIGRPNFPDGYPGFRVILDIPAKER